jgi:hypothetical protein
VLLEQLTKFKCHSAPWFFWGGGDFGFAILEFGLGEGMGMIESENDEWGGD